MWFTSAWKSVPVDNQSLGVLTAQLMNEEESMLSKHSIVNKN